MKILAYRITENRIENELSGTQTDIPIDDLLDWLLFSYSSRYSQSSCRLVVWSLSELVDLVSSRLPKTVASQLLKPPFRAQYGNYKLFCIPDKLFAVSKNGVEAVFYDLSQYDVEVGVQPALGGLQAVADRLSSALSDLGIPSPSTLSSPLAVFRQNRDWLHKLESQIPTIFDFPESILDAFEIAMNCTPREWTTNYRVGHFPGLYNYDISSAYPYEASNLIDLRDCTFRRSDTLSDSLLNSSYYGFLVGSFTVNPDHSLAFCSPFLAPNRDGFLTNFTGTVHNYPCSLEEVRTLYRHNMGSFKLDRGWFISPANGVRPRFPFKQFMQDMFALRGDDDLSSYLVKRVMNGVIGKMLETRKDAQGRITDYGDLYNSIYHALCTAGTRLRVFDFIVKNQISNVELVHVGVDGIKTTRAIDIPTASKMGAWRSSGQDSCFVLSPGGIVSSSRNLKNIDYDTMLTWCLEHPGASSLSPSDFDLRRLFLNQTRDFGALPKTAGSLLHDRFISSAPVF